MLALYFDRERVTTSRLPTRLLGKGKRPQGGSPATVPPTPPPHAGSFMADARRQHPAPASGAPPKIPSTDRAPTTPLLLAEATADDAAQSRAANEGLLETTAGGSRRAAPTAGGGKVRDPWSTFKEAKESTLAFAAFASQAFDDLEGDLSVSFYPSGIYIVFPPST